MNKICACAGKIVDKVKQYKDAEDNESDALDK